MSTRLLSLLQSSWGRMYDMCHTSFAEGISPPKLREDSRYVLQNRYSVLEYLEDNYPSKDYSVSTPNKINVFQANTMTILGGGETVMREKMRSLERRGGAVDDQCKTIKILDRVFDDPCPFTHSVQTQCEYLGLTRGCVKMASFKDAVSMMTHNFDANPGPTWRMMGFDKKRESMALALDIGRHIADQAVMRPIIGYLKPRYALAGRTKLAEKSKFAEKAHLLKPFGRTVFMADQHEAPLAAMFVQPLTQFVHNDMKCITNGFNKFGDDPTRMCARLEKHNLFINGDFSSFDNKCSARLISRAFDILRYAFDVEFGSQADRILDWLEDEVIYTEVVLATGKVVRLTGGVPSGSGLTAIIDSIICAIMWQEVLYRLGEGEHVLYVHGDDNLVGLTYDGPNRDGYGKEVVRKASKLFLDLYGHELSPDKTTVGTSLYVSFAQPRVPEGINDHSRQVVMRYRKALSARLGRPLTFDEMFIRLDEEPIGPAPGMTHRWTYVFNGRAKFLSHYFKKDPTSESRMMIRPTAEVIQNILYPEGRVKSLDDHIDRLIAAWVENMGNHHVTNRVMHYLYDAWLQKRGGFYRKPAPFNMPRRAWYRKIDYQVDLLVEDHEFFQFYRRCELKARKAYSACFGGRYASWEHVRALRRGKFRLTLGGPLSRLPGLAEINCLFDNRSFRETLGPLGFNIWAHADMRASLGKAVLAALDIKVKNYESYDFLGFESALRNLRASYGDDFAA